MTSSHEEFTVKVLMNGSGDPDPAGVGFIVDETHIVTCAHVVNTALGRDKLEQDQPDPGARVRVALPLLDGVDTARTISCMVQKWVPPPTSGVSGGDVAGLAVDGDGLPAQARAAWLADYREFRDAEAKLFGYPGNPPRKDNGGWATVRVRSRVDGGLIELDATSESAFLVQAGYSGSPVVVTDAGGHDWVAGMLAAARDRGGKDALAIPAVALALAWPEVVAWLPIEKCPYRGLEAFTADDADVFAGREDDIDRLREMVRGRALTILNGPSGVGKSSLVNAGLIPRLEAEGWASGTFRPGGMPVDALARTLASMEVPGRKPEVDEIEKWMARIGSIGLSGAGARLALALGQPVVLHADQLEEILDPQICAPGKKAEFLELLLSAPSAADEGLHLVGTVRADFMAQLLEHPDAGTRLAGGWFGLSPMSTDRLETVITQPASKRGVRYEDGLAAVIASDAGNGPALPLLEFTLTQLWEHKRGPEISHAAYQGIGGVAGALNQYVEGVYADNLLVRFPEERIRRVLLGLVRSRGGAADSTRRVASRDRLGADWDIVQVLARYRLVTIGRDDSGTETAEIAHEALIREWPTLTTWVDNDSDFQRWLSMAEERAADGELLPDTRLADADRWLADRAEDILPEVRQLIQDSKSEWRRRISELEDARNRAEAGRLAATAELALAARGTSRQIPIILAIEALKKAPVAEAENAMRHAIRTSARPITRADHDRPVNAAAFSPDGTRVATASGGDDAPLGGEARVIDAATGAEIWRLGYTGPVRAVAFSPNGTRVATASGHARLGCGEVRVVDAATGAEIWRLGGGRQDDEVTVVAFSPDGTRVATASSGLPYTPHGGEARVFDAATGAEIWRLGYAGPVRAVAFSRDGTRVATVGRDLHGGEARVIDAATGAEISRLNHAGKDDEVIAVAFSRDGTRVATVGSGLRYNMRGGGARAFDAATGAEIWRLDHAGPMRAVAFSRNGTRVATVSEDARGSGVDARVIDAATGAEISRLDLGGADREVTAVAFSRDGTRVATASSDLRYARHGGEARVFDAATGAEIWRLDHAESVHSVTFSPDGTRVATANGNAGRGGEAWVCDAATGPDIWRLDHAKPVRAVAFSPDGTRVATVSSGLRGGGTRVIDAATGAVIWHLDLGREDAEVHAVAFSPDGTRVATASSGLLDGGEARVIDAATGAVIWHLDHAEPVHAVTFSPDGTRVATASGRLHGGARVIDAATATVIWHLDPGRPVHAVTFSPDGTRVATAGGSGARVFDAATGAEIWHLDHRRDGRGARAGEGAAIGPAIWQLDQGEQVRAVAFSPDGTRVATGSGRLHGGTRVIDAATGAVIWHLDHAEPVRAVAFSPDGTRVATASGRDTPRRAAARVLDAATGAVIWHLDPGRSVNAVAFSPDGTRVATASGDLVRGGGDVRVIDAATGIEISRLDHDGEDIEVTAVAFSPDGTRVATASSDGRARVFAEHSGLIEQALSRLTRNLTRQEWSSYFPGEPYRKTRADLP